MKPLLMMKDFLKINFAFLLLMTSQIFACDICNSSATNTSSLHLGSNNNYIGLIYNYLDFQYKETIATDSPIGNDYINPIRIVGNYNLLDKINLTLVIPYLITNREGSDGIVIHEQGIGDVSLSGTYNVLHHLKSHILNIGVGVKAPTGNFSLARTDLNQTSANQLGTGSWDVFFPLQYTTFFSDFTLRTQASYYFKGTNDDEFKFGDQLSLQANVSYPIINKQHKLLLSLGALYDNYKEVERFDIKDIRTEGNLLTSQIDVQYQLKSFVFGANYRFPIDQELVEGDVEFNEGFGFYTYYQF